MKNTIATAALFCLALGAQAQSAPPGDNASMVKPPTVPNAPNAPAANAVRPDNPDNMPVKRPATPPGSDRMLHHSPASDAIAK